MTPLNRRQFLKSASATGAGLLILKSGTLFGQGRPSSKLNIALIGVWGRGLAHYNVLKKENVVALCDVNELRFPDALKAFPGAKTYVDWRKCLEQKDIDAVVCCTPDHHHAHVAIWAMNRDKHVYMEKPIALTVDESRQVRALYLKKKNKLATQAGTQRHAIPNFQRVKEMVRDGAVGKLQGAFAWGNRQIPRDGYLPADGTPPSTLHWDLWLGPSPEHPYNPGYLKGGPGANCLEWNMYWDFGTGQVGDMGAHTMDLAWNAVDATHPTAVEAKGDPFNPAVTPVKLEAHFEHPANDWRPNIRVSWYQGKVFPTAPVRYLDFDKLGHGAMFKGTGGVLISDFNQRMLLPDAKAGLSDYSIRPKDKLIPPIGDFQEQWVNACKGDPTKTSCNFDYNGLLTEQMALGLVAYRAGKKLKYDGKTGKTDDAGANQLLSRAHRGGWALNG
jgi:predicted dehydrogenase